MSLGFGATGSHEKHLLYEIPAIGYRFSSGSLPIFVEVTAKRGTIFKRIAWYVRCELDRRKANAGSIDDFAAAWLCAQYYAMRSKYQDRIMISFCAKSVEMTSFTDSLKWYI